MIVTCDPETYPGDVKTCGETFDDEKQSTVCPHRPLAEPVAVSAAFTAASGPVEEPEPEPGLFGWLERIPCPLCDNVPDPAEFDRQGLARHLALEHDTTIAHVEAEILAASKPQADAVGPDLEPPPIPDGNAARARYLLEHVLWAADRGVELDASGLAARAQVYATLAVADALTGGGEQPLEGVCGAEAVVEWQGGHPFTIRWCDRTSGPCPFAGATTLAHYRREIEEPLEILRDCAVQLEGADHG